MIKNILFILFVGLGVYYCIDYVQPASKINFGGSQYNLVSVHQAKNGGYVNKYVKPGDNSSSWDESVDISTFPNVETHKEYIQSTSKMVRGRTASFFKEDYRGEYSAVMFCLPSKVRMKGSYNHSGSGVECSYIKAERKGNTVTAFQYSKRYPKISGSQLPYSSIGSEARKTFENIGEVKIPFVAKKMPTEGKTFADKIKNLSFSK